MKFRFRHLAVIFLVGLHLATQSNHALAAAGPNLSIADLSALFVQMIVNGVVGYARIPGPPNPAQGWRKVPPGQQPAQVWAPIAETWQKGDFIFEIVRVETWMEGRQVVVYFMSDGYPPAVNLGNGTWTRPMNPRFPARDMAELREFFDVHTVPRPPYVPRPPAVIANEAAVVPAVAPEVGRRSSYTKTKLGGLIILYLITTNREAQDKVNDAIALLPPEGRSAVQATLELVSFIDPLIWADGVAATFGYRIELSWSFSDGIRNPIQNLNTSTPFSKHPTVVHRSAAAAEEARRAQEIEDAWRYIRDNQ